LIGADAPTGTVEVLEVLGAALDAARLPRARVGLGDAGLYSELLSGFGVTAREGDTIMQTLARHDFVALEQLIGELALSQEQRRVLIELPTIRGGREVFDRATELGGQQAAGAVSRLRQVADGLEAKGLADRVIFDLGLVRDLGYYTGAIFEVYDPALGHVLGGGGRYDELLGRFGQRLPACGFALFVERVHVAQAEEERS
jgi:ATP phosphoribosyltransferase regulatory subunit